MRKLILLACALLLAACGVPLPGMLPPTPAATLTPRPSATPTASPTPTITPTPAWLVPDSALRGTRVTFWHPWTGPAASELQNLADDFNRGNTWGIRVEVSAYGGPGALFDAVLAAPGAGGLPSAVAAAPEQIAVWEAQMGLVMDLNGYLDDPAWASTALIYPNFLQGGQAESAPAKVTVSLPAERDAALLFYNVTWAQELGFSLPPTTPDAFREQVCAAQNALLQDQDYANNGTGGWILNYDAPTVLSWMYAFGAPRIETAGTGYLFASQPSASALTYLRGMLDEGCAWRSRLPQPYEYFANRQALFYTGSLEDIETQALTQTRLSKTDTWTVLPFSSYGAGVVMLSSGLNYAVFQSTPAEQLAAWAFIRWMLEPEQQARLALSNGMLALSDSAAQRMSDFARANPQWAAAQSLAKGAHPAPENAAWRSVQHLLEDAAWMALQPNVKPEQIPDILTQLDGMVGEVLKK